MTLSWESGRRLASVSKEGLSASYVYNTDGIRTQKTVNGVTTNYYLDGNSILRQVTGNDVLEFFYDANGVLGFYYNNTPYYYLKNLQGDIVGILDANGTQVVSYTYDAWGAPLSVTGTAADTIGQINPFRYRSYYYDNETGLYYLNSRYYDPETCRFINADGYIQTGQGMLDKNMFTYCENNPINRVDTSGMFWKEIGNWVKNAWNSIKSKASSIFGSGHSSTVTIKKEEEFDPLDTFLPFSIRSGIKVTQTVSEHGDTSKPVSAYGIYNTTNPILSSSGGIKINISNVSLDISLGLEDMGIFISSTNGDTTNSFGLKVNMSQLRVGFEGSTSIKWDNITDTTYTNTSFNGWFLIMLYEFVMTGQPMTSPSPSTNS